MVWYEYAVNCWGESGETSSAHTYKHTQTDRHTHTHRHIWMTDCSFIASMKQTSHGLHSAQAISISHLPVVHSHPPTNHYRHTHTHTHSLTHTHTHTHSHTHTHTHTHTRTHMHTCTDTHTHTHCEGYVLLL